MPAVKFGQDTCTVTLNLEKLCDLPLANIRKLYAMILSEPWRADNTDAAATMAHFLMKRLKPANGHGQWPALNIRTAGGLYAARKPVILKPLKYSAPTRL